MDNRYRIEFTWDTGSVTYYLNDVPRKGDYVDLHTWGAGDFEGEVRKVTWHYNGYSNCESITINLWGNR